MQLVLFWVFLLLKHVVVLVVCLIISSLRLRHFVCQINPIMRQVLH